ncbi:MAG: putative lipoprotein YajG [Gammaproteobacteria bacterium]|jgi:uncharacterized lipoprotein YajG
MKMQITHRQKSTGFLLAVNVLLAACTLSPQTINITPSLDVSDLEKTNTQRLWIDVTDIRKDNTIGYRGGVYETDSISTDTKTTDSIYREITAAFNALGFVVVSNDSANTNKLIIEIDQLSYKVTEKKILWRIELFASIKVTVDTATKKSTLTLQDRRTKDYPKFPSMEQNEEIINKLVSSMLQRLLEDNEMIALLKN